MTGDGKSEADVRRRIQVCANAWRKVEGVMADRKKSRKLKGKVLMCVTPTSQYHLETAALQRDNKGCWYERTTGSGGLRE